MSKQLNMSSAVKKPAFDVPKVSAPGLSGTPPLPAGKPMVLKKVSPSERAVLSRFGWKEGDPVPSDLAEIISDIGQDLKNPPPPVDLKTPVVSIPKEIDIKDLPESEQDKYMQILAALSDAKVEQSLADELDSTLVKTAQDPIGVNNAIRAASGMGVQLELEDDSTESGEKTVSAKQSGSAYCPHCGWDQSNKEVIQITEDDKISFLQSVLGLKPFEKLYTVMGGRLSIVVRTLTPDELDTCFQQLVLDRKSKTTVNPLEEAENLARYRASIQIVSVTSPGGVYRSRTDLSDAPARTDGNTYVITALEQFKRELDRSETHHKFLLSKCMQFNELVRRLEDNIDNSDFWPAIA